MKLKTLWILSVIQAILSGIVLAYTLILIYQVATIYFNVDSGNFSSGLSTVYGLIGTGSFLIKTAPTIAWIVLILEGIVGGLLFQRAFIVGDRRLSKVCILTLVAAVLWLLAIIMSGQVDSLEESMAIMLLAYLACSSIGVVATILFTKLRKRPDLATEFATSAYYYPNQNYNNQYGQYPGQGMPDPNQQTQANQPTVDPNGQAANTDQNWQPQQAPVQPTPGTTNQNNWNMPPSQLAQGQQGQELKPLDMEELKTKGKEAANKLKDAGTKGFAIGKDLFAKGKEFFKTKKGKKVALGGGIVVVAIVGVVITINVAAMLKTYPVTLISSCEVTFSGYDGEGKIQSYTCEADYDVTNDDLKVFAQTISYEFFVGDESVGETLSNGDVVTVIATYSAETAKSLKVSTSSETIEITVSGLTEVSKTWDEVSEADKATIRSLAEARFDTYLESYISRYTSSSSYSSLPSSMELVESRVVGEYYLYNSSTHRGQLASIYYFMVYSDYDENDASEDGVSGHYCIIYVSNIIPDREYTSSDSSSSYITSTYTIDWESEIEEDVVAYMVETYLEDYDEVSLNIDNSIPEVITQEEEEVIEETEEA